MLALYFQQFTTRGQKNTFPIPGRVARQARDRLDHVLTAIENDKKLLRANEVDRFHSQDLST